MKNSIKKMFAMSLSALTICISNSYVLSMNVDNTKKPWEPAEKKEFMIEIFNTAHGLSHDTDGTSKPMNFIKKNDTWVLLDNNDENEATCSYCNKLLKYDPQSCDDKAIFYGFAHDINWNVVHFMHRECFNAKKALICLFNSEEEFKHCIYFCCGQEAQAIFEIFNAPKAGALKACVYALKDVEKLYMDEENLKKEDSPAKEVNVIRNKCKHK